MGKGYRDNSNKTPNKLYHENGAGRSACGKTRLQTANAGYTLDNKYTSIRNPLGTKDDRLMELFERCWKEYRQTVKFLKELKKSKGC